MDLNTKVITVGILSLNAFGSLVMSPFGKTLYFLLYQNSQAFLLHLHLFLLTLQLIIFHLSVILFFKGYLPQVESSGAPTTVVEALTLSCTSDLHEESSEPTITIPTPTSSINSDQHIESVHDTYTNPSQDRNSPSYLRDYHYFSTMLIFYEPQSYQEACTDPIWQQAMQEEHNVLETYGT
jgi:hypothetical protein